MTRLQCGSFLAVEKISPNVQSKNNNNSMEGSINRIEERKVNHQKPYPMYIKLSQCGSQ